MATVGNYRIKKLINEGGFANIYQAEHVLLEELACLKQCKRTDSADHNELLRQEAKLLWKLSEHHSIPHAKDFLRAPDRSYVMVMDYIDGQSLDSMIPKGQRMHPEDACWITERLLSGLYYCHYMGVIHSDVKPGNVIVEAHKHDIKLIDFGLSVYKPTSSTKPVGYTEAYVAPELLNGGTPIPETDLYGAGIVMLYALGGDTFTKEFPKDTPVPIKDFCNALLRYNPVERPNWEKADLVKSISDIRQEVFGRRHTSAKERTSIA
jgi:serine/threonine-protein kinase